MADKASEDNEQLEINLPGQYESLGGLSPANGLYSGYCRIDRQRLPSQRHPSHQLAQVRVQVMPAR